MFCNRITDLEEGSFEKKIKDSFNNKNKYPLINEIGK